MMTSSLLSMPWLIMPQLNPISVQALKASRENTLSVL